jgi:hypothetical protein
VARCSPHSDRASRSTSELAGNTFLSLVTKFCCVMSML